MKSRVGTDSSCSINKCDYRAIFAIVIFLGLPGPTLYAADDPCTVAYRDGTKANEFNECERAANAGNAQAEFGYGLILFSGHDRKNDHAAGLDWLERVLGKAIGSRGPHWLAFLAAYQAMIHSAIFPRPTLGLL